MLKPDNLFFIIGSPRSGTTWIGKIFDSHPGVIYRHEPDAVNLGKPIPFICNDVDMYREKGAAYMQELALVRDARTNGKPPIFSKNFRNDFLSNYRTLCIYALRYGGAVIPSFNRWAVPDFTGPSQPRIVIKSVSALGRAGLFMAARSDSRILHILRHPCGHVGSVLRGERLNKMAPFPLDFVNADSASHYDLSIQKLEKMTFLEQAAWRWVIFNHKAMQDLEGNDQVMTLVYEDLCADPMAVTRRLFDFAGLSWHKQTEEFLHSSTHSGDGKAYHTVYQDPLAAANKWRSELSRDQISAIAAIVRDTVPGRLFSYD
ncbi:MAG: sulfotransferase family protein [Pseudomonadota bacterium]|jgi:hypothetical protein|nr:hypothetical protein [Alphaproteobacteria bacterium]